MSQGQTACPLIASIDATGVRATNNINYKDRTVYKTSVGGAFSAIAYAIILATAAWYMYRLITPRYFQSEFYTYLSSADAEIYNISVS